MVFRTFLLSIYLFIFYILFSTLHIYNVSYRSVFKQDIFCYVKIVLMTSKCPFAVKQRRKKGLQISSLGMYISQITSQSE